MCTSNRASKYNPHNLTFHISPDITIEYVGSRKEVTNNFHTPPSPLLADDDDDCDQYFNPVSYCTITMDEEGVEEKSDISAKIDDSHKINKKPKLTQSNENSSFVCNATDAKGTTTTSTKTKKRHSCPICPKTFGWTTDLKRHLLIHTGERPFKCTICTATFTRNFLLQKHKAKFHQCLSPNEISQLNNNVAKNVMEIKQKMLELQNSKDVTKDSGEGE